MAGKYELKTTHDGKFHFVLKAGNGEVVLSGQTYTTKASARDGIESVRKNAPHDDHFERKTSAKGQPYFVLHAGNKQVIGESQMYSSTSAMEGGIASVKSNADSPVVEVEA
jgi:uncharacterized protein YegP (UPF0339 family)